MTTQKAPYTENLGELVALLTGYAHAHRAELAITPISCRPEYRSGWRVTVDVPDGARVLAEADTLREACADAVVELLPDFA